MSVCHEIGSLVPDRCVWTDALSYLYVILCPAFF